MLLVGEISHVAVSSVWLASLMSRICPRSTAFCAFSKMDSNAVVPLVAPTCLIAPQESAKSMCTQSISLEWPPSHRKGYLESGSLPYFTYKIPPNLIPFIRPVPTDEESETSAPNDNTCLSSQCHATLGQYNRGDILGSLINNGLGSNA
ncbi:hypothetical protein ACRALDRAFT_206236 [Sodiomyces alcalophilus JCM 7366]|uniref:uncharacterized protein n=1 Tax=Sodiomyces alcalophilus JCM 7366 TaxID=591952 RepID=UPI0039B67977